MRKSIRAIASGETRFHFGEAPELLFPISAEIRRSSVIDQGTGAGSETPASRRQHRLIIAVVAFADEQARHVFDGVFRVLEVDGLVDLPGGNAEGFRRQRKSLLDRRRAQRLRRPGRRSSTTTTGRFRCDAGWPAGPPGRFRCDAGWPAGRLRAATCSAGFRATRFAGAGASIVTGGNACSPFWGICCRHGSDQRHLKGNNAHATQGMKTKHPEILTAAALGPACSTASSGAAATNRTRSLKVLAVRKWRVERGPGRGSPSGRRVAGVPYRARPPAEHAGKAQRLPSWACRRTGRHGIRRTGSRTHHGHDGHRCGRRARGPSSGGDGAVTADFGRGQRVGHCDTGSPAGGDRRENLHRQGQHHDRKKFP